MAQKIKMNSNQRHLMLSSVPHTHIHTLGHTYTRKQTQHACARMTHTLTPKPNKVHNFFDFL